MHHNFTLISYHRVLWLKACYLVHGLGTKADPVYEGRLKVILLLQVSNHDFEPTFIILSELKNTTRPAQIKTKQQTFDT